MLSVNTESTCIKNISQIEHNFILKDKWNIQLNITSKSILALEKGCKYFFYTSLHYHKKSIDLNISKMDFM